jgi:hypothetical protein
MMALARPAGDGVVLLQAFFPDGGPARGVRVEIRRPDGSLFTSEQTDEEGRLTVRPDGAAGTWTARFIGSTGHAAEASFEVGEVPAAAIGPAAPPPIEGTTPAAESFPWTECLAGLGFIFGLGALLMCLKLRAEVRGLARSNPEQGRGR